MKFSDLKVDAMFIFKGKIGYKKSEDTAYIPSFGAATNFNMLPNEKVEINEECIKYNQVELDEKKS